MCYPICYQILLLISSPTPISLSSISHHKIIHTPSESSTDVAVDENISRCGDSETNSASKICFTIFYYDDFHEHRVGEWESEREANNIGIEWKKVCCVLMRKWKNWGWEGFALENSRFYWLEIWELWILKIYWVKNC